MSKETIAVVGATGKQGGSVVNALLKDGKYHIRGITRSKNTPQAVELDKKGVEVVEADIGNKEQLTNAFRGVDIVFGTTNSWDKNIYPNNMQLEEKLGKMIADVAKEQGVKLIVWR